MAKLNFPPGIEDPLLMKRPKHKWYGVWFQGYRKGNGPRQTLLWSIRMTIQKLKEQGLVRKSPIYIIETAKSYAWKAQFGRKR